MRLFRRATLNDLLEKNGIYRATLQHDPDGHCMSYWESTQARLDRWGDLDDDAIHMKRLMSKVNKN